MKSLNNISYEELRKFLSDEFNKKPHGYIKQFCEQHKMNYEYVLNSLSHKNINYPKMLMKIAQKMGYEVKSRKIITYQFDLSPADDAVKTVFKKKPVKTIKKKQIIKTNRRISI